MHYARILRLAGVIVVGALAAVPAATLFATPIHAQTTVTTTQFRGKTALVTGSTDGLGRAVAMQLAAGGAHVIIHGRNTERGNAVVDEITKSGVGSAEFIGADFASLDAVRAFADTIARRFPKLDILVNNAGIATLGDGPRRTSADGYELQFAVNYLAGWVLVHKLRPSLEAAKPSRVVNVASISANPIDYSDVMLEKPGANNRGYGQSKLAQVMMTIELAPEFAKSGITMLSLHPATYMNTTMVLSSGITPRTTVEQGRDAVMNLITSTTIPPGSFYNGMNPGRPHPHANDAASRAQLMTLSAQLTKIP